MRGFRVSAGALAAILAAGFLASFARAETFPARPIRIVVPNEPGGIYDLVARLIAAELSNRLPERVYVENKPGAGSILGTQAVASAMPDGYTLLMGGLSNIVFNAALYRKLSYDPMRDFVTIALVNKFAYLLVGRADLPYASLPEIIAAARQRPDTLILATPGVGTAPQIIGAAMMKVAGVRLVEVPYKGVQAPLTDMLAGRVDMLFVSQSAAMPYIRDGRIKAIATADVRRSKSLPELPTLVESNVDVSLEAWLGLFAPARTPVEAVELLRTQTRAALPSLQARLEAADTEMMDLSPQAADDYVRRQYELWTRTIRELGLTLE
jgi:tripartite-type tricarboxylate transporter receptor subunit TctC